jgi:hypothetical protein
MTVSGSMKRPMAAALMTKGSLRRRAKPKLKLIS